MSIGLYPPPKYCCGLDRKETIFRIFCIFGSLSLDFSAITLQYIPYKLKCIGYKKTPIHHCLIQFYQFFFYFGRRYLLRYYSLGVSFLPQCKCYGKPFSIHTCFSSFTLFIIRFIT